MRRGTTFLFLAAVVAAVVAAAAGCASPPAAARQAEVTAVSAESVSVPRGDGLLAFSGGGSDGLDALYTAGPDGSRLRRLPIPAGLRPFAVAWSPDGRRLAFSALGPAGTDLYLIGADGKGFRQLTHLGTAVSDISWSPGGQWLAFVSDWDFQESAFVVRADGTGLRHLLTGFTVESLAWGPDGRLALSGTPLSPPSWLGVWTVNANGTDLRRISREVMPPKSFGTLLAVYGWTGDGRELLVQSLPGYGDLSLLPAAGGQPHVILHCPLRTCVPAPAELPNGPPSPRNDMTDAVLSPDGRTIALIVGDLNREQLYQVPAAGGRPELIRVTGGPAALGEVSWQPAGR